MMSASCLRGTLRLRQLMRSRPLRRAAAHFETIRRHEHSRDGFGTAGSVDFRRQYFASRKLEVRPRNCALKLWRICDMSL